MRFDWELVRITDPPPGAKSDPRRCYYTITVRGRELLEQEAERLSAVMGAVRRRGVPGRPDRS